MPDESKFRVFSPPQLPKPVGYSHLAEISAGKIIYIAGQVAMDASGNIVGQGDYKAQLQQVFANLKTALEAAGTSFKNVVKLNYYIVDSVDRSQFFAYRELRDKYVDTSNPPVATVVIVRGLFSPEFLVEIEAIAVV
ncbi:MAG TPA: RidA family protein [Bryobacteraceae bacterium]|jgi:enamine deaminase RidA (YjgF/YER057c/UK114 family)|nr:RidA family protein [Bryobacteraceae bacterium]